MGEGLRVLSHLKGTDEKIDGIGSQVDEVNGKSDQILMKLDTTSDEIKLDLDSFIESATNIINSIPEQIETGLSGIIYDINHILNTVDETNLIVKDILKGTNIAQWVNDLIEFGEESVTYKDNDRMNTIVSDTSACKNAQVTDLILKWASLNNKTGTYFGNILEISNTAPWESLRTPANVMSNEEAFKTIVKDKNALARLMNNAICKIEIYNQKNVTQNVLKSDATALSNFKAYSKKLNLHVTNNVNNKTWNGKYFVFSVFLDSNYNAKATVKMGDATIYDGAKSGNVDINAFADYLYMKGYYVNNSSYYYTVVDF